MPFSDYDKVAESNRIEGIHRPPTQAELDEHRRFMTLDAINVAELCRFVSVYQPGAVLRDKRGLNVRVGNHIPPAGGPEIPKRLELILALLPDRTPWEVHMEYERVHPFTDGNGRSGRVLWHWMMRGHRMAGLGFLHAFYYQTLAVTPTPATVAREEGER